MGRFQRGFERGFDKFRGGYYQLLETTIEHRGLFASVFLAFCLLSLGWVFFLGEDFFPSVDAGLIRLHVRGRAGLRVEETARSVRGGGTVPASGSSHRRNRDGAGQYRNAELQHQFVLQQFGSDRHQRCRNSDRPERGASSSNRRQSCGSCDEQLPRNFPGVEFFFQPADIVTQILNFGLPAPIDIQVIGADLQSNYGIAQQIANQLRHVPGTADVHVQQMLGLPTLHLEMDRDLVTQVGMNPLDVAQTVLVSLSGSFQTAPAFWLNPKNGVTYSVAVQTPQYHMTSLQELMNMPVNDPLVQNSQVLGNLVQLTPTSRPAVVSHYNIQPVIDVYASTQGRDLGAVAKDTNKVLQPFMEHLPRGTQIVVRGQVETMRSSFVGLGIGLMGAISAGLFPDRGEFPVVARSVRHHHRLCQERWRASRGFCC